MVTTFSSMNHLLVSNNKKEWKHETILQFHLVRSILISKVIGHNILPVFIKSLALNCPSAQSRSYELTTYGALFTIIL